ncbi:hypothetical protein MTO96_037901 [Rhipicephalus appendiculatus]
MRSPASSQSVLRTFETCRSLCGAIQELAVCRHITSLRLRFDRYDEALYNAAADVMVIVASTVREMELYAKDFYEEDESRSTCQIRLIGAVALESKLDQAEAAGLIDVASRLVMRDCGDPYGVNALQLVAEHPKLAETVARKAEVTEAVARSMIEETLQLIAPSLIE